MSERPTSGTEINNKKKIGMRKKSEKDERKEKIIKKINIYQRKHELIGIRDGIDKCGIV